MRSSGKVGIGSGLTYERQAKVVRRIGQMLAQVAAGCSTVRTFRLNNSDRSTLISWWFVGLDDGDRLVLTRNRVLEHDLSLHGFS